MREITIVFATVLLALWPGRIQAQCNQCKGDFNGDGTITDATTGLMWEKKSDDNSIHDQDNT